MNDFEYDCKCKKDIARSAHNHVNARRGKCKLPHEYLTKKELNELNGEVKTYDLGNPMDLDTFRGMPEDLKRQYIEDLQERFHANDRMLAEMLGCSAFVASFERKKAGVAGLGRGHSSQPTDEQLVAWKTWLRPGWGLDAEDEETEDTDSHVADAPQNDTEEAVTPPTGVLHFRVSFGGVHSWEELYALAKQFPFPEHPAAIDLEVW